MASVLSQSSSSQHVAWFVVCACEIFLTYWQYSLFFVCLFKVSQRSDCILLSCWLQYRKWTCLSLVRSSRWQTRFHFFPWTGSVGPHVMTSSKTGDWTCRRETPCVTFGILSVTIIHILPGKNCIFLLGRNCIFSIFCHLEKFIMLLCSAM